MSGQATVVLPDLSGKDESAGTGWMARSHTDVVVPSLADARACNTAATASNEACEPRVTSFDPPNHATLIDAREELSFWLDVSPSLPVDHVATLSVKLVEDGEPAAALIAIEVSTCRTRLRFRWEAAEELNEGWYELSLTSRVPDTLLKSNELPPAPVAWSGTSRFAWRSPLATSTDYCAIELTAAEASVAPILKDVPESLSPPLLATDSTGCVREAWSVDELGRVLKPDGTGGVQLFRYWSGGVIAVFGGASSPALDAIFWDRSVAVLMEDVVTVYDLRGCPAEPLSIQVPHALALALSDEGFLVVVCTGKRDNVRVFRHDGSEVAPPAGYDGRGWYARHRSAAFVFDERCCCGYRLDPSLVATGCCVEEARALAEDECALFALVDDLPSLRKRLSYKRRGEVIIAPKIEEQLLDAGRPGTQWHRIVLFGEIPEGCAVNVQTRATDDLFALDPLLLDGWSDVATATSASATPVESPADQRLAAADVMVLAGTGRYLSIRLTLLGNGRATPRIRTIEVERPREGISRNLPRVFRESTPEDDFLRRWLALFESTGFDGVARRLDEYAELFQAGTAPDAMLPYLSEWQQVPYLARFVTDPAALRTTLARAPELARTRGTVQGLVLAVELYLGIHVHVVESYRVGSDFVLGAGTTFGGQTGPVLGCQTILTSEPAPSYLGDAKLGCTDLLECDERQGSLPHWFDVLVPARLVCASQALALLRAVIELEKPAHTNYRLRLTGAAGWVVGTSLLGEAVREPFEPSDPTTYGVVLLNGPPRPKPIGEGFRLGFDSRLPGREGPAMFELGPTGAKVGVTTRLGE